MPDLFTKRSAFLKNMKGPIYRSEILAKRLETKARMNIEIELKNLESRI